MVRLNGQPICLPFHEWRRLRRKSLAAQQHNQMEACGVLGLTGAGHLALHFLENSTEEPCSWELSNSAIRKAARQVRRRGQKILGLFHSHPISKAIPGSRDRRWITSRRWQLIYDVCGTEARLWRKDHRGRLREVTLEIQRSPNISIKQMASATMSA
jgi:proteasome lid subunit RPN8/RPN11